MSSHYRGVLQQQVDCLICDKIVTELHLGLCLGCHMDLHYTWAICEPEKKEKPKSEMTSLMDALYRAHYGLFGSFDDDDNEGWKHGKGNKKGNKGYLDDEEGVGINV